MLLAAVRQARERAKYATTDKRAIGDPVFKFLLDWAGRRALAAPAP